MFFIASKILDFLTHPLTLVFTCFLLAWIKKSWRRRAVITGIVGLYVFSNAYLLNACLLWWEPSPVHSASIPQSDVAIVLGGYSFYEGEVGRIDFHSNADRLLTPLELYAQGHIEKILLSGGSSSLFRQGFSQQEMVQRYLYDLGLPLSDVLLERNSRNTHENATMTMALLDSLYTERPRLLLVTSAMHMRRSLGCFEKVGLDVVPLPVDHGSTSFREKLTLANLFIPNAEALAGWNYLLHEVVGYLTYAAMGYL